MPQSINRAIAKAHFEHAAGNFSAAGDHYRQALEDNGGDFEALIGLALCLEQLGDFEAAREALLRCLAIRPQTAYAHYRLGWLKTREGNHADALPHYLQAAGFAPGWYEPFHHAAVSCTQLRRYPEAIVFFKQALGRKADLPELWYHYAKTLKDAGQLDDALLAYQNALMLKPDYPEAAYSLGLMRLLKGDWLAGWAGYELRWQGSDRAVTEHRPATILPLWQGEEVAPESGIMVYSEQGMGDSIMCFRYAKVLNERFAQVKFAVTAPLVTLFQQSAPERVDVVARIRQAIDESGYTHYIHTLSLPAAFKTTPECIPSTQYLKAAQERANFWQQRLVTETRLKVGLVWRGGKLTYAPARDMAFPYLAPLLELDGICWVSLQKDESPPVDASMIDLMNDICDMADTAALVANLDLVIAVDTAVAHLAGALGKPVWLLNRFESEWRWMRGKDTTPWYPSMRIFDQPGPGDWVSVIQQVKRALIRSKRINGSIVDSLNQ